MIKKILVAVLIAIVFWAMVIVIVLKNCLYDGWTYSSGSKDRSIEGNIFIVNYHPDTFSVTCEGQQYNFNEVWLEHPEEQLKYLIGENKIRTDKKVFVMIFSMPNELQGHYFLFVPLNIERPKIQVGSGYNQFTCPFDKRPPDSITFVIQDYRDQPTILDTITFIADK